MTTPPPEGYLFAGGGTGGHLTPAIAVARALQARRPESPVLFVGTDRALEGDILAQAGFAHQALPMVSLRQLARRPFSGTRDVVRAVAAAKRLLRERRPRVVIGCGGFASAPCVWAAHRLRIPIVLLEQNVLPGRATRWLSRFATRVCLSFEESRQWLSRRTRCVVTGNPVRAEFIPPAGAATSCERGPAPATTARPLLLILGGSLGAGRLNRGVLEALSADLPRWRNWEVIHQTGAADCESVAARYAELGLPARVVAFIPLNELPSLLSRVTLVVTRAGATTLAELACRGVCTIVVPWAESSENHQMLNAVWHSDRDAMLLAEDGPFAHVPQARPLQAALALLADDPSQRAALIQNLRGLAHPDAVDRVLEVIADCERRD